MGITFKIRVLGRIFIIKLWFLHLKCPLTISLTPCSYWQNQRKYALTLKIFLLDFTVLWRSPPRKTRETSFTNSSVLCLEDEELWGRSPVIHTFVENVSFPFRGRGIIHIWSLYDCRLSECAWFTCVVTMGKEGEDNRLTASPVIYFQNVYLDFLGPKALLMVAYKNHRRLQSILKDKND